MNEHGPGSTPESETPTPPTHETPTPPTQEQLYDDLRRIGQLEDQKRDIQREIDDRTRRLQDAIPGLDQQSLLYQLLTKAMPARAPAKQRTAAKPRKKTAKKTTKKTTKKK